MSQDPSKNRTRLYLILGGAALLAIVLVAWLILGKRPDKKAAPHPIPVTAVKAETSDFQINVTALGAAQAWTSDLILAQVSGKLIKVNFQEGSEVRAGQLIAEVDPRPYEAALAQAQGTLKRDQATLAGAKRDLERYQHLIGEGGVSKQVYEDEQATVGQDEGTVEIDMGSVAAAKLNLEFCRIVSPVSGRAGVRLVDPGNLVSASGSVSSVANTSSATSSASASTSAASSAASNGPSANTGSSSGSGIVVINQIQPIAVTFNVPQGEFQRLLAASHGFTSPLTVKALSQETGAVLDTGALSIADNRVDQATGTVELKARFTNDGRNLWPGQFVNVSLGVQTLNNVVVLPMAAVNRGPKGQYVFLVAPGNKVKMQTVELQAVQGQSVVVKSGVKAGDVIVTDGQMLLNNGSLVKVSHLTSGTPAP